MTDEEVNNFTEKNFKLIEENPEQLEFFKSIAQGLWITLDEYKEQCKETYRQTLIINKRSDNLKKSFFESEGSQMDSQQKSDAFKKYLTCYGD